MRLEGRGVASSAEPSARRQYMSVAEIFHRIKSHIFTWDEDYSHWYCGITSDPDQVQRELVGGALLLYEMESELEARRLEIMLREEGCEAIPHPGGQNARFIYVFLSSPRGVN